MSYVNLCQIGWKTPTMASLILYVAFRCFAWVYSVQFLHTQLLIKYKVGLKTDNEKAKPKSNPGLNMESAKTEHFI